MVDSATSHHRSNVVALTNGKRAASRDATRGGVNGPASPGQRGRESPLGIDRLESSNRAGD
jgi:hypothetical protein